MTMKLSDEVFAQDYNETLIHQVVTAYLAKARSGTHRQKTRAEVSGGGAKPWNQKGSGRARAGTTRGPLWRHGGVTFAARQGDYSQKVNKKMYRAAMRSILSQLMRDNRIVMVDEVAVKNPKTKELVSFLAKLKVSDALIIVDKVDAHLALAGRNLPNVSVIGANYIDPVNLLAYKNVVATKEALMKIDEALK